MPGQKMAKIDRCSTLAVLQSAGATAACVFECILKLRVSPCLHLLASRRFVVKCIPVLP
jgi:hypothetical protein